jgi:hypothetical protein
MAVAYFLRRPRIIKAAPASRATADVALVGSISGTGAAIKVVDIPRTSNITAISVRMVPPTIV